MFACIHFFQNGQHFNVIEFFVNFCLPSERPFENSLRRISPYLNWIQYLLFDIFCDLYTSLIEMHSICVAIYNFHLPIDFRISLALTRTLTHLRSHTHTHLHTHKHTFTHTRTLFLSPHLQTQSVNLSLFASP